jgi:hypothetical protein
VAERVRVREIDDDEGRRLVRIVRRDSGSVVTWRRAQMLLLSAQGMDVAQIAKVAFTGEDRHAPDLLGGRSEHLLRQRFPRDEGRHPAQCRLLVGVALHLPGLTHQRGDVPSALADPAANVDGIAGTAPAGHVGHDVTRLIAADKGQVGGKQPPSLLRGRGEHLRRRRFLRDQRCHPPQRGLLL